MTSHETYMQRCLQLALLGADTVAPNPMVGAVLVCDDRIIGEGYHRQFGQAHAEVNCVDSVLPEDHHLLTKSTLYVSLEPCAHQGKTPPCVDLVLRERIPKVVIGTRDPFSEVNGKGIEKLQGAGVEVVCGVLEKESRAINRRFFCFHEQHRPYVVLKWAETADGYIGSGTAARMMISGDISNRLVHKWRSEEMAIMIGTNTALMDDPSLDVRTWKGRNPVRMAVDLDLSLPRYLKLFASEQPTIIFNKIKNETLGTLQFYQVTEDASLVHQVLNACYQLNITSLLVEGGARLLQSFIDDGSWDEVRVIINPKMYAGSGLPAPVLSDSRAIKNEMAGPDSIVYFAPDVNQR